MSNLFEDLGLNIPSFNYANSRERTGGITGVIAGKNQIFRFLKSRPYSDIDVRDPVWVPLATIQSEDFYNSVALMRERSHKTQQQIKYNSKTGSGNFVQYSQGFDFLTDYHRLIAPFQGRNTIFYLGLGLAGLFVWKNIF